MNRKRFILISGLLMLLAASLVSCKKDEKETKYLYFSNSPTFDVPSYVSPGDVITATPKEVRRSSEDKSDKTIGYAWGVAELSLADTLRYEGGDASKPLTFSFTVPDTLCTINVRCSAFASGYSSGSFTRPCIIVKASGEKKSLTGTEFESEDKIFTDARDGKKYHYSTINGVDWMSENLCFEGYGEPFASCEAMTDIFGLYYTWTEAMKVCPEGWSLPSNDDWLSMCKVWNPNCATSAKDTYQSVSGDLMANAYLNKERLWEFWPSVNITNKSKLSIIPTGYGQISEDIYSFYGATKYAVFWVSDSISDEQGCYRMMHVEKPDILLGATHKDSFVTPVRCIRK